MKERDRPRPYRQVARAARAAATGERILDAFLLRFWADPAHQPSLDEVAREAGVSVQTVIRRFGGRDGLVAAASERESARVAAERDPASVRSPEEAVTQLVAHYERMGDQVLVMLAEEARVPALRDIVAQGRATHRAWCETVFATHLAGLDEPARTRRVAQLVAVTDVYTWKLLRRDSGLDRAATEGAMTELLTSLLEVR
jgi:AcrR family transcriptional regulator